MSEHEADAEEVAALAEHLGKIRFHAAMSDVWVVIARAAITFLDEERERQRRDRESYGG